MIQWILSDIDTVIDHYTSEKAVSPHIKIEVGRVDERSTINENGLSFTESGRNESGKEPV